MRKNPTGRCRNGIGQASLIKSNYRELQKILWCFLTCRLQFCNLACGPITPDVISYDGGREVKLDIEKGKGFGSMA